MFALSFHEFAHAWMASKCGDNTAARMGRLTLNPMAHLDVMGSLMILFVGFGWAKPVPVNSRNLRDPRKDMMKVAAAGPLSNLLSVSYTHLRAHETSQDLVCRLLLEKKN